MDRKNKMASLALGLTGVIVGKDVADNLMCSFGLHSACPNTGGGGGFSYAPLLLGGAAVVVLVLLIKK